MKNGATVVTNGEGLVEGLVVTAVSGKFLKENLKLQRKYIKFQHNALPGCHCKNETNPFGQLFELQI